MDGSSKNGRMNQPSSKILTIPVPESLHKQIHETAKQAEVPVRIFGRLVLEKALEDIEKGTLRVNTKLVN